MTLPIDSPTAPPAPVPAPRADDAAIRAAIQAFADGAATQDVALLEAALHPASVQFVPGATMERLERDAYLDLIGRRQLGGLPLAVDVRQVSVHGDIAQAAATFTSSAYALSHSLSLARHDGRWTIVSTVVTCTH